jgi:hypothetical protein
LLTPPEAVTPPELFVAPPLFEPPVFAPPVFAPPLFAPPAPPCELAEDEPPLPPCPPPSAAGEFAHAAKVTTADRKNA